MPLLAIFSISINKLLIPCYFRAFEKNMFHFSVVKNLSLIIVIIIILEIVVMYSQIVFGPRFFYFNNYFDDRTSLYKSKQELLTFRKDFDKADCLICLNPLLNLVILDPETANLRDNTLLSEQDDNIKLKAVNQNKLDNYEKNKLLCSKNSKVMISKEFPLESIGNKLGSKTSPAISNKAINDHDFLEEFHSASENEFPNSLVKKSSNNSNDFEIQENNVNNTTNNTEFNNNQIIDSKTRTNVKVKMNQSNDSLHSILNLDSRNQPNTDDKGYLTIESYYEYTENIKMSYYCLKYFLTKLWIKFFEFHESRWGRKTLFMLTKCLHAFHSECLENWLKQKGECPTCRAEIIIN